jgi:hypothetical protein
MSRLNRLFRFPVWLSRALLFLGMAWIALGWAFQFGLWITFVVIGLAYGLTYGRRVVSVTLEPYSRERGIVIWARPRRSVSTEHPRVVWEEPVERGSAPQITPPE